MTWGHVFVGMLVLNAVVVAAADPAPSPTLPVNAPCPLGVELLRGTPVCPNEPPSTPTTPSGPGQVAVFVQQTYCSTSTDPEGQALTYVFDWQDGVSQTSAPSGQQACSAHSWSSWGNYCVTATATDPAGGNRASACRQVFAHVRPNTPSAPTGPATGVPLTSYTFCSQTTDPDGDSFRYNFDWGDGTTSSTLFVDNGSPGCASHAWRYATQPCIRVSAWDGYATPTLYGSCGSIQIINYLPHDPTFTGPTSGRVGQSIRTCVNSWDPEGNSVRFEIDFDPSFSTGWQRSGVDLCSDIVWSSPGQKCVKARVSDDYNQGWTAWTFCRIVTITE